MKGWFAPVFLREGMRSKCHWPKEVQQNGWSTLV